MKTNDMKEIINWFYKVERGLETHPLVVSGVKLDYVNGHIEIEREAIDGFDEYTTTNISDGVGAIFLIIDDLMARLEEEGSDDSGNSQDDIAYVGVNGEQYKRSDIVKLCNGNERLVDIVIDNSIGFPPEVVLERLINEGDVIVSYEVNDDDSQSDEPENTNSQGASQYYPLWKTEHHGYDTDIFRGAIHKHTDSTLMEKLDMLMESTSKYKNKAVGPSIIRGTWLNPGIPAILKSSSEEEDVYPPYTVGFNRYPMSEESIMANMNIPPYHQTLKVTEDPLLIKVAQFLMRGATIDQIERIYITGLLHSDFDLNSYDDPDNKDLQLLIDYTGYGEFNKSLVAIAEVVISLLSTKNRSLVGTTFGENGEYVYYDIQHVVYIKDDRISCVITKR